MQEGEKTRVVEIIDTNHDGRLQADEYVAATQAVMRSAARNAAFGCGDATSFLVDLCRSGHEDRFVRFNRAYASRFANGIEVPSRDDFETLGGDLGKLKQCGEAQRAMMEARATLISPLLQLGKLDELEIELEIEMRRRKRNLAASR